MERFFLFMTFLLCAMAAGFARDHNIELEIASFSFAIMFALEGTALKIIDKINEKKSEEI